MLLAPKNLAYRNTTKRVKYLCGKIVVSSHASNYSTLNRKRCRNHQQHPNSSGHSNYSRGNDFLAPLGPRGWTIPPNRSYGMLVVRILRGALKLRYLVLGGAIGGGMTLNKKYEDWKDGLPDLKWLEEALPQGEKWSQFSKTLIEIGGAVKDVIEIAKDEIKSTTTVAALSLPGDESRKKYETLQSQVETLQTEIMNVQIKYQKELEKIEKENRELRQQYLILKQNKKTSTKRIKKSLIDMYSEVLDELSGYDINYTMADHLPRVVVVGDQSSGKTSVLESIAKARIFPRGSGEMMTRAPVKVTLAEGPYHVAQFRDSEREYDLNKESDLAELRTDVEFRMRASVRGNKTVSNKVISMSVKGPGLQRMILVDLPGIISVEVK